MLDSWTAPSHAMKLARPRFTVLWLMVAVAIVAIDIGVVMTMPEVHHAERPAATIEAAIVTGLPMSNFLAVGLLIGRGCLRGRPFLSGFEVMGSMACGLFVFSATTEIGWNLVDNCLGPFSNLVSTILDRSGFWSASGLWVDGEFPGPHYKMARSAIESAIVTVPQLAIALAGGFLFGKFSGRRTLQPGCQP